MTGTPDRIHVHGTCVSIGGRGVLIRGVPGSGKSELALRLIDSPGLGAGSTPLQAMLVADDQTALECRDGALWAMPHPRLTGLLELRGQGILRFPHVPETRLSLVVDLLPGAEIERMPESGDLQTVILGVTIARIPLDRGQPAAPSVIRAVLTGTLNLLPRDGGTS